MNRQPGGRSKVAKVQAGLAQIAQELRTVERRLRLLARALPQPRNRDMLAGEAPFDLTTELSVALEALVIELSTIIEQIEVQSRTTEETAHLPWKERKVGQASPSDEEISS